jgi:hypothetical protein
MNFALASRTFNQISTEALALSSQLDQLRASSLAPQLDLNCELNDLAQRLDSARVAYLRAFPTSRVTADKLRQDEIATAARAGCAKLLAKQSQPIPTDGSWDHPLDALIADTQRAAQLLATRGH